MEITAVLDFDFAHVIHPFEQFHTMSFTTDLGYSLGGSSADSVEAALISGDFTTEPNDLEFDEWNVAKNWNEVLGFLAPSNIKGVDGIVDLLQLQNLLYPHRLSMEHMSMEHMSKECNLATFEDEKKKKLQAAAEAKLLKWLEKHGFY